MCVGLCVCVCVGVGVCGCVSVSVRCVSVCISHWERVLGGVAVGSMAVVMVARSLPVRLAAHVLAIMNSISSRGLAIHCKQKASRQA